MSWRLRHEGSPQPVPQPLSTEQIVEGLKDGVYGTTDEVRGPGDAKWLSLENHPHFSEVSEVIQAIESEMGHEVEDNTIDMNPLIDVCLVLLVFFILATTLSVMEKVLRLPNNSPKNEKPITLPPDQLQKYIMLKIEKKGSGTVFKVNDYEATSEETLLRELERMVKEGKTEMILDIAPGVEFNAYTMAVDNATQARITKIMTKSLSKAPSKGGPAAPTKTTAPPSK